MTDTKSDALSADDLADLRADREALHRLMAAVLKHFAIDPGEYDTDDCVAMLRQPHTPNEPFQPRVAPWMLACFGAAISADRIERNHRFLEESLELVQANGCTRDDAHQLVDYVFGRPVGELHQEIGGVMVTLAALCLASGQDMHEAGEVELARIWTKVEAIRAKQAAKPKGSPLPQAIGATKTTPDALAREAVAKALHDHEGEDWTWPEHDDDDGYRGGGYVRVTPIDMRLRYRDRADVAIGALKSQAPAPAVLPERWAPTHRHVKRGTTYQRLGTALLQASTGPVGEAASLVVYRDEMGRMWARPEAEFDDGRFVGLQTTPSTPSGKAQVAESTPDALAVLRALTTNPHVDLGDLVYQVRDQEGQGWDGPATKAWSDAVAAARTLVAGGRELMTATGKVFYVSMIRGRRVALLAGPFVQHEAALAMVDRARDIAGQLDPWSDFDAFGTVGIAKPFGRPGVLNERLGVTP